MKIDHTPVRMRAGKRYRVDLADHGQDFLYFIIQNSTVIEAGPFQNWLWSGKKVLNTDFCIGNKVELELQGRHRCINHPVTAIRILEDD